MEGLARLNFQVSNPFVSQPTVRMICFLTVQPAVDRSVHANRRVHPSSVSRPVPAL